MRPEIQNDAELDESKDDAELDGPEVDVIEAFKNFLVDKMRTQKVNDDALPQKERLGIGGIMKS